MATIEHPRPEGLLHNAGFSQVVVASGRRIVHTAGQVAIDERGALVGGDDLAAQTAQAMRNVGLALKAAGAGYSDIVKITTYVVDYKPEHRAIVGRARAPFFADIEPAREHPGRRRRPRPAGMADRDRGDRRRRLTAARREVASPLSASAAN